MRCVLRLDWDKSYEFVTRNKGWFVNFIFFVAKHFNMKVIAVDFKESPSGNTHVYVHAEGEYCKPPERYLVEAAMGGDLARSWYNWHRFVSLGMDVDVLFARKRKGVDLSGYIPEWLLKT